jgi:hypothetical protein
LSAVSLELHHESEIDTVIAAFADPSLESTQPPDGFMASIGWRLLKQTVNFAKDFRTREVYCVHAFVSANYIGISGGDWGR